MSALWQKTGSQHKSALFTVTATNVWDDDSIGIKLDTYNDSKLAYQFFINPFGVQAGCH